MILIIIVILIIIYEVYRYSYDETAENASKIATVTECAYKDKNNPTKIVKPYGMWYIVLGKINIKQIILKSRIES